VACHEGGGFAKQIQIGHRLAVCAGLAYQNESRCACSIGADNSQLDTINADFGLSEIRTLGLLPIDCYGQRGQVMSTLHPRPDIMRDQNSLA
jgi:hypothetical protein